MDINKGLNGFQLKILALVFMTLDHIYYFFNGILPIPYIFTIIGRLAMPIFVFSRYGTAEYFYGNLFSQPCRNFLRLQHLCHNILYNLFSVMSGRDF